MNESSPNSASRLEDHRPILLLAAIDVLQVPGLQQLVDVELQALLEHRRHGVGLRVELGEDLADVLVDLIARVGHLGGLGPVGLAEVFDRLLRVPSSSA
ncbi:MAG: hypothetical protein E6J64_05380 [Deltaproteobacteria bacterium]|nr:MAG: hypothetical protein E6J64_05380 [Deltaproteobacteria bacterium]